MNFGLDKLLADRSLLKQLRHKRIGLVAHPASVTRDLVHSVDALIKAGVNLCLAFGPQHGMRGDKQDNMIESDDYVDPVHGIPVVSLYGEHRYPTQEMLDEFDILLFDLQDIGCRIYTFLTTLFYFLEACARANKTIWVLDRPNPAGRTIDGMRLQPEHKSFVGCTEIVMRHGLTVGEFATWAKFRHQLDVDLKIIPIQGYDPTSGPGFGWPAEQRAWINPSPNAASLNMCRCFAGTVLLEGTNLSEGRGTTMPLEVIGAPGLQIENIVLEMEQLASHWMQGAHLRRCYFEPVFHKHQGEMCNALQIHTDLPTYQPESFKPYRLVALFLRALLAVHPGYDLWRDHAYEYETGKLPIDVINGGPDLRSWVEDSGSQADEMDARLTREETEWFEEREPHLIYR
jgi:uncharacterized protein YbbC (DUF1343 family)